MATTVHLSGGRDVAAPDPKPIDLVAFERKFKTSVSALAESFHLEHVLFLAWHALKRVGTYAEDFEKFLAEVDDFDTEDEPGPLAQSSAPSQPSQ